MYPVQSPLSQASSPIRQHLYAAVSEIGRISAIALAVLALLTIGALVGTVTLTIYYPKAMLLIFALGIIGIVGFVLHSCVQRIKEQQINMQNNWDD